MDNIHMFILYTIRAGFRNGDPGPNLSSGYF